MEGNMVSECASDEAVCSADSASHLPVSFKTALIIPIPRALHDPINELRMHHDKAFPRWMPHVTLLFPFVPCCDVDTAAATLRREISRRGIPDLTVHLRRTGTFPRRGGGVLFLRPELDEVDAALLQQLHQTVQSLFPSCGRQRNATKEDADASSTFHPHVTLGQFSTSELFKAQRRVDSQWMPLGVQFTVQSLQIIVHRDGSPGYEVAHTIPFVARDDGALDAHP